MNTICISIECDVVQQEILIAKFSDLFDGFEQSENKLDAFVNELNWETSKSKAEKLLAEINLKFATRLIPDQNWNETWEKNFEPLLIDHKIYVRATFHPHQRDAEIEIIINPKMSFGTGHHATTAMMMQLMLDINFMDKSVLDFGSGTGILSILASKQNAAQIISIDHEEWAYKNMIENFEINHCSQCIPMQGSAELFEGNKFEIVLANINLNILLQFMSEISNAVSTSGTLLLSGIMPSDENQILKAASENQLLCKQKLIQENWMAMQFEKI